MPGPLAAEVRDRILTLLVAGVVDPWDIKADACIPYRLDSTGQTGLRVHGDDYLDPEAWELSEGFAHKYWFLFDWRILRRTNWWRRSRGEKPIHIPALSPQVQAEKRVASSLPAIAAAAAAAAAATSSSPRHNVDWAADDADARIAALAAAANGSGATFSTLSEPVRMLELYNI